MSRSKEIYFVVPHDSGGGWAEVAAGTDPPIYVRFRLVGMAWKIAEVRVLDPAPDAFRRIPLTRIETAANANELVSFRLGVSLSKRPPDDVPAYFAALDQEHDHAGQRAAMERAALERPTGRHLDDDFYRRVAEAYRGAAGAGLNPRQTLANDTGSAPDTVARWVGEARKRGYLPKGQAGKVTAGPVQHDQKGASDEKPPA